MIGVQFEAWGVTPNEECVIVYSTSTDQSINLTHDIRFSSITTDGEPAVGIEVQGFPGPLFIPEHASAPQLIRYMLQKQRVSLCGTNVGKGETFGNSFPVDISQAMFNECEQAQQFMLDDSHLFSLNTILARFDTTDSSYNS